MRVKQPSSSEAYLTEKRAREQAECERIATHWRHVYEARLAAEHVSEDPNDEYASRFSADDK